MRPKRTSLVGAAFAAALTFAMALPCAANTRYVTSNADDGAGTLRAALASADDGDIITFDISPLPTTIALTSDQLEVGTDVTITGPGQELLTVDGGGLHRVFYIREGKTVAISHLTIANGLASGGGGVVSNGTLTLEDCTLSNNTADGHWHSNTDIVYAHGGAIAVSSESVASLTVNRCILSGNTAIGRVDPWGESTEYGVGGGIYVDAYGDGDVTVTVTDSTLVGNTASGTVGARGGAIAIGSVDNDPEQVGANVIIRNSTLTGNSAVGGLQGQGAGYGGAISNFLGSLTIDNSTLAGNYDNWEDLQFPSGGAVVNALGTLKIKNTILANAPPNVNDLSPLLGEESGVEDMGFNLCTDDCSTLLDSATNLPNTAPLLGPLDDNGGPTLTHALLPGSPAIDVAAATDSAGYAVEFDQRGVARPQGSANDIGAFEFVQATTNSPPTADPGGPYLAAVNAPFAVDGSASSDPDGDSLIYSWEFDNTPQTGASASFVAPAAPGIYTIALRVDDGQDGDTASTSVVIYDASAGFVTGGGWIASPAGAYFADPDLVGKATFGFVSKYRKGATVPTGNTAFEFAAGDLYLQSTSYEWLVVTGGDYAKFKGSGTINGTGDYRFMVWAGDNEPDTFRIRIWQEDEATGVETAIYDNGFDQAIGGGSIVIHTK